MISFDASVCTDLTSSMSREWLETNGRGGFASATLCGMNTRRYHGLLVAALSGESERVVLLSRLEETLVAGGERFELSTNRYAPGVTHPEGFRHQTAFRLDPFPIFTFRCGDIEVEKSITMLHGENTTVVRYQLRSATTESVRLEVRPLIAFRSYHHVRSMSSAFMPHVAKADGDTGLLVTDESRGWRLRIAHDATDANLENIWYERFAYPEEINRGFSDTEDLFNPCLLRFELRDGETRSIIASDLDAPPHTSADAELLIERERVRRLSVATAIQLPDVSDTRTLLLAADAFLVERRIREENSPAPPTAHPSVIAGYHWFTDWGRDTMIALPGLTLATNRLDDAERILLTFAAHIRDGLIPNYFPDRGGEPSYNTADATLWFVHSAGELMRRGRAAFVRMHLYERLKEIVQAHVRGTRYGIHLTEDGLLRIGEPGVQLTWMDAKIGDYVVTPRDGKPVEIQALWYNALRTIEEMATKFSDEEMGVFCERLAAAAQRAFASKFWNEDGRCLYDCLRDDGTPDAAIRPNQIFAVSLPHPVLDDPARAGETIATVERELLTPYGLRSLSPADPSYRGRYEGDTWSRDTAYHQGTVWAWLSGHFITAHLRVNSRSEVSLRQAHEWLAPLHTHLREAGLGQVSEIFDGDAPHTPRGCIAQAWSVAELLRCELEELAERT